MKTLPILDGVRAIAALLVLLRHISRRFPESASVIDFAGCGYLGVFLFFTLSGFLMTYHYLPGESSLRYWRGFMVRRFFRIYPAFLLVTLLCIVLHPLPAFEKVTHFAMPMAMLKQLLLWRGYAWFWTIPVEIRCYIAIMLFALAMLALPRFRYSGLILSLCLLLPLSLFSYHTPFSMRPYISFVIGMAAGYAYKENIAAFISPTAWAALAIASALLIMLGIYDVIPMVIYPWHHAFFAPLLGLFLFGVLQSGGRLDLLLANRPIRFLGLTSYSLYLTHQLCLAFTAWLEWPLIYAIPAGIVLSFLSATLLYYAVEKPGIAIGKRLEKHA